MYRNFYSYSDMPVVNRNAQNRSLSKAENEIEKKESIPSKNNEGIGKIISNLENDDIILLVVFFILIMDNCDDKLLLLALAFIFFSDYFT